MPDSKHAPGISTGHSGGFRKMMHNVKEKMAVSSLHDVHVKATHVKNRLGKFENLINPNHRHDEAHERATDAKRQRIRDSHRFNSYFPERDGNKVKWYIDGRNYFWAVSVALERAKETIYIADWWLSPELFLRRPPHFNQHWRLDQVLKRRAEAGVKIWVIVYKEVEAAITCNSTHTKNALRSLCPEGSPGHGNINVMRHPDHNVFENVGDMTFYWAHHEKFMVIDYKLAFIGGLDLCFGRWDTRQHPLADVSPEGVENTIWPGQDFNNNRIMDFQSVNDWKNNELDKAEFGRMPWHDVSMGVIGPAVYDIAEHFVLRWNFCKRDKYKRDERFDWLVLQGRDGDDEDLISVQRPKFPVGEYLRHPMTPLGDLPLTPDQGTVKAQIVRSSADWSSGILVDDSIQRSYKELIRNAKHLVYIENQFFITATGEHQAPIQNTVGEAIVDAIIKAAQEQRKFRVIVVIPSIPGFAGDLRDDAATGTRAIMDYQYKSIHRGSHSIFGRCKAAGVDANKYFFIFNLRTYDRINYTPAMKEQVERSGVSHQELQRANAEDVMSSGIHGAGSAEGSDSEEEHDDAGDAVKEEALEKKRRFEAERDNVGLDHSHKGDNTSDAANVPSRTDETKQADSVDSIAKNALLGEPKVADETWNKDDPESELQNFIQEELYPHDKVLIIDDQIALCGSSNLNDRSQLGFHDSELAIVMEDTNKIDTKMGGKPWKAGQHAATLRRMLWREHLGLLPAQPMDASKDPNSQPPDDCPNNAHDDDDDEWDAFVSDPLDDKVWDMWTSRATTNTDVFRDMFHADPDNTIHTFDDYEQFLPRGQHKQGHLFNIKERSVKDVKEKLDKIKGHLVWMPLDFLRDAEMAERGLQLNSYTESIYT